MADYRHDWDLGRMGASTNALKAMGILQSRPNDIFPFQVQGRAGETDIRLGSTYDLVNTTGPLGNWGAGPDPVRVSFVGSTKFTFLTLAGHHRGPGQTISFETYDRLNALGDDAEPMTQYMHIYLAQYGTYIASFLHPFSTLFNWGIANNGAVLAWALQAHNLRVALGTYASTGLASDEAAADMVLPNAYRNVWPGG